MRVESSIYEIKGKELILRNPEESDAERLLSYLKTTSRETPYLIREQEEITLTLEEEKEFIKRQNNSEHKLLLIGMLNGKHVGNCSLMRMDLKRYQHRAVMAIALYQKYTGLSIGRIMIEKIFSIAKAQGIEQIELEVAASNQKAVALYKKLGFETFGTFPDNMKYKDGTYEAAHWMMKKL